MVFRKSIILAALLGLAACSNPSGVGFGEMGSDPSTLPQGTSAEFSMDGVEPLPIYVGAIAGQASPAEALSFRNEELRKPEANLIVTVEARTYGMRQIELNGENFAIVEGAAPVASLPTVLRARTGCLVLPNPLRSDDAAVYTLDCT